MCNTVLCPSTVHNEPACHGHYHNDVTGSTGIWRDNVGRESPLGGLDQPVVVWKLRGCELQVKIGLQRLGGYGL